jgi:hypothetical protein
MILVDSNVPMYLVGGDHPHKMGSRNALERLISAGERLVTDAEVLQEILHRYSAIDRRDTIQSAFDALLGVVDQVLPIDRSIVEAAKGIVVGRTKLSARDAIHYAVMQAHDITRILSFDSGFDGLPGVERLHA